MTATSPWSKIWGLLLPGLLLLGGGSNQQFAPAFKLNKFAGYWEQKSWTQIANMDEFSLFCIAFPERFFINVVIPKKELTGDNISLHEFYVWLGLNF